MTDRQSGSVSERLLGWYDRSRRDLPWRYAPDVPADPYRVWLSEIMLQQTTVKAVVAYFLEFTRRWPTVGALAAAPIEEVLAAWAGLGYYARARNLHACAGVIVRDHGGRFPANEAELMALPGVGPYTAAAIAAIGFGLEATPVDGNVERVVARVFAIGDPMPGVKPDLRRRAQTLTPPRRAGDFAQAMMDLGATICTPKRPACANCPISPNCRAHALGIAAALPLRSFKAPRPDRYGIAFVVQRSDGAVLVRRRPEKGLLGGMIEVPTTAWVGALSEVQSLHGAAPIEAEYRHVATPVVHVFTHFRLSLQVRHAVLDGPSDRALTPEAIRQDGGRFVSRDGLDDEALPTVMRKVLSAAGVLEVRRPRKG